MITEKNHLLIIGAPRSGSTWLFNMLSLHQDISSFPYELTLFNRYFSPILTAYDLENEFTKKTGNKIGMPVVAERQELIHLCKRISQEIYNRSPNPERKWILDKHPFYSMEPSLIAAILPGVYVIDLIRDGREVSLSWMNTFHKAGFGAPDMRKAAMDWDKLTRSAAMFEGTKGINYLKIYYHDLINNPTAELKKILQFAGLTDNGYIEKAIKEKADHYVSVPDDKVSHESRKSGGSWKDRMSYEDRLIFNSIAGEQLKYLGFEKDNKWLGSPFIIFFVKIKIKLKNFFFKFSKLFVK